MSESLLEFRKRYPIRPYDLIKVLGEQWEAISFPWPTDDGASINIRKPGDPTTLIRLDLTPLTVLTLVSERGNHGCS